MPSYYPIALPSMLMVGVVGLFVGGLVNYIANLLLNMEGMAVSPVRSFSWHKIGWQYPLVGIITATLFLLLTWHFGISLYAAAMMTFVTFLLIVCITDFKAKIIPHEVTYPAILLGIIFSVKVRGDLFGALAGIGVSYILFDFLAFYGLKIYTWLNKPTLLRAQQFMARYEQPAPKSTLKQIAKTASYVSIAPLILGRAINERKRLYGAKVYCKGTPLEELEVIGGGDAVLSALISAWLGWEKLVLALVVSFMVGTVLGAIYLLTELWKERLMKTIIVPVSIAVLVSCCLVATMLFSIAALLQQPILSMPYLNLLPVAAITGFLLGVIVAGSKISKPFPFGPALVAGAIVAIFFQPKLQN